MGFLERVTALPHLGLGVSTEYGAAVAPGALDVEALRAARPHAAAFLEIGVEVARGLDDAARAWLAAGRPATYHFLDVNLGEPGALGDGEWRAGVERLVEAMRPAWVCGDAGLWHFGARERGHMLLLPPILTRDSARDLSDGVRWMRDWLRLEVLPENPPGTAFVGDLHLLDFFAEVAGQADTGLLLDVAHLAIYQQVSGHDPLTALDGFPLDRVVEVHVAGGELREVDGWPFLDDVHGTDVHPSTWAIFEHVVARAPNLRAVVFECERNACGDVLAGVDRITQAWAGASRS